MSVMLRLLVPLLWLVALPVQADQPLKQPQVSVTDAVLRLPIPGTHNSAVFLTLHNKGAAPVALVGVSTAAAEKAQLHNHTQVDGMMRMRPVKSLPLAPGATQALASGGYHIMLFNLAPGLTSGDTITLTLEFASGATQAVQATAQSRYDNAHHGRHHP
jgi:copper(I)-binding protein